MLDENGAEARRMTRDADVAGQCERESAAMCVPVDGGNDGLAQAMNLLEKACHELLGCKRAHEVAASGAEQCTNGSALGGIRIGGVGFDVGTGTKRPVLSGDDHHPDGGITSDAVDFAMQIGDRIATQCITAVRAGQLYVDDAWVDLGDAVIGQC